MAVWCWEATSAQVWLNSVFYSCDSWLLYSAGPSWPDSQRRSQLNMELIYFLPRNHNQYPWCLFRTVNTRSKGCWTFCVELDTSHCYLMFVIFLLIQLLTDVLMITTYRNKMWKLCDKVKWVTQRDETISTWIYRAQQKLHCMGSLSCSLSGASSCSVQWVFRAFSLKTICSTMADEHRACEHSGAFQVEQLNKQIVL